MAFIRKVKTSSGATAVQIVRKSSGRIVKVDHLGSAHTKEELEVLMSLANKRLQGGQQSLFPDSVTSSFRIRLKQSFSRLLFQVLKNEYQNMGFSKLNDEYFACLCIARIVEPTSKLDSQGDLILYKFQPDWLRFADFTESTYSIDESSVKGNIFYQIIPQP